MKTTSTYCTSSTELMARKLLEKKWLTEKIGGLKKANVQTEKLMRGIHNENKALEADIDKLERVVKRKGDKVGDKEGDKLKKEIKELERQVDQLRQWRQGMGRERDAERELLDAIGNTVMGLRRQVKQETRERDQVIMGIRKGGMERDRVLKMKE